MRNPRIYIDQPLRAGTQVELGSDASRHLLQVLRLREGAPLTLFNGQGGEYSAQLVSRGKQAEAEILEVVEHECESPLQIHLAQAISKGDRMDYTIQKSVELGVNSIQPLFSERSVVRLDGKRLEKRLQHWQGVIISACEQCGRNTIPELKPAMELRDWLRGVKQSNHPHLILNPLANQALSQRSAASLQTLLIGPEGGFSANEIEQAQQAGCEGIRLGPRILRTETAALAAIAVMQANWGDFG